MPFRFLRRTLAAWLRLRAPAATRADTGRLPRAIEALLADPGAEVRCRAVWGLERSRDTASHQALLRALKDEAAEVRAAAVYVLGESVEDRSAEPCFGAFIAALDDPASEVREKAAQVLSLTNAAAAGPLVRALSDHAANVRAEAIQSLGNLGVLEATDLIAQRLYDDADSAVREAAAFALGEFRHHPPATAHLLRKLDTRVQPVGGVHAAVLSALGHGGDARAVPALCAALKSPDTDLREEAARAIGSLLLFSLNEPVDAIAPVLRPALRDALDDTSAEVRAMACQHLATLEDRDAIPGLLRRLKDHEEDVREAALKAVGELDGAAHADAIAAGLSDASLSVQRVAAQALRLPVGAQLPPAVAACLDDPAGDAFVKEALLNSLARNDDPAALPRLLQSLDDASEYARAAAARALQSLVNPRAVAPLIARLCDEDWQVRAESALALGAQADDAAIAPLQRLLSDPVPGVRRRVVHALSFLSFDTVVPLLTDHLRRESDPHVLATLADSLVALCEPDGLRQLLSELPRRKAAAREALMQALADAEHDQPDEDGESPSRPPRRPGLGTVHYE